MKKVEGKKWWWWWWWYHENSSTAGYDYLYLDEKVPWSSHNNENKKWWPAMHIKSGDKEKILKSFREKKGVTYKRLHICIAINFSIELEARKQYSSIFEGKAFPTLNSISHYQSDVGVFKNEILK